MIASISSPDYKVTFFNANFGFRSAGSPLSPNVLFTVVLSLSFAKRPPWGKGLEDICNPKRQTPRWAAQGWGTTLGYPLSGGEDGRSEGPLALGDALAC